MQGYGKRIISFVVVLLVIHGVGLFWFDRVDSTENPFNDREAHFESRSNGIPYLVAGNSRAYFGIDDSLDAKFLNYAALGETSIYTYYQVKHALESGTRIEAVLFPADVTDIYSLADHYTNRDYCYRKNINYTEIGWQKGDPFPDMAFHLKRKLFPYSLLINWQLERSPELPDDEYAWAKLSADAKTLKAQEVVAAYEDQLFFQSKVSLLYLEKTIALCEAHEVDFIPIKYPLSPSYRQETNDSLPGQGVNLFASDSILSLHGLQELDLRNVFDDSPECFRDPHHLSTLGRERFTRHLAQTLAEHHD